MLVAHTHNKHKRALTIGVIVGLKDRVDSLMKAALAPSTRRSYKKYVIQFREFCHSMSMDVGGEDSVELWIAHLNGKGISHGVI